MPIHIIINLLKVKDKENFESIGRKVTCHIQGNPLSLPTNLSAETLLPGESGIIDSGPKRQNCQPGILLPEKLSFRNEGEIKTFSDNQKLREFIITRPALQKC